MHRTSPWLVRRVNGEPSRARLICLPYAGGNARLFHNWTKYLRGIEILAVEAPGKGSRLLEPPITDLEHYCRALLAELAPLLEQSLPYSFFGHSSGAVIAFELCCRLQAAGARMPQRLILSACGAPWARVPRKYSSMDDVAFKDLLRELNATPPEILADEMVLDLLLPGLHADFALTENYTNKWRGLRGVITHIIHGVEDTISEAELSAWQTQVALPITIERLPGGHFFIHEKQDALLNAIARQLATEFRVDATSI